MEKYKTIVADPPWPGPIADWRSKPLVVQKHSLEKHGRKAPSNVYPLMSLDAIKGIKVPSEDLSHLWLWALPQHVDWAIETATAWGFVLVHVLAWAKPGFGTGGFQANTEYIVLARKGGPKNNAFGKMSGTHFNWPKSSVHSTKPEGFYQLVEKVSPGPYLELFARRTRPNWTTLGNELGHVL